MKNKIKQALILTMSCILGCSTILHAQSVYRLADSKAIVMKLSGTSTLHKWDMNASVFTGHASFVFKPGSEKDLTALKSLTFILAVANLSSGEKGLDKNAYKALKTKQFKTIVYKLASATVSPESGNKYLLKTHGDLSIAGVTKPVMMDVECVVNSDGTITCTGTHQLNMTDYAVKPPKFMLGAMTTGDAITLTFTLVYKKTTTQLAKS
jgi:polyisoprenoid-binding protein YceI